MDGEDTWLQPLASRNNVLLCQKGDPFEPTDLVNMFAAGVWGVNPETGIQWTGTFNVEHWRLGDADKQMVEGWSGTTRTLQHFDREDRSEVLPVVVFHTECDPETRVCASCGRSCGTG